MFEGFRSLCHEHAGLGNTRMDLVLVEIIECQVTDSLFVCSHIKLVSDAVIGAHDCPERGLNTHSLQEQ